jgi:hypothetical protein
MFVLIVLIVGTIALIAGILFYQLMAQEAAAVCVLSCRMDHGHFSDHWVPCYCKCHQMPKPQEGNP